ncbi:phosphonate C-P lyase system protein PhnH [Oleomonas cavernae]|uniref:Phosphonate C-P lyase system protein PhnH n=1 Tax=Oleomonas cavernae TaxID=2320859 RepID=A0A418W993_9PROT|nr:phosphonate C-P lyase system protein PhnH [Oleomonas cavernae]RJF86573.1 phosphonate C-P lyase system protein PhnH [Oleomonas cavernae]
MTEVASDQLAGLLAGFTDPVGAAQGCFRAVLDAMSRPGRIVELGVPATAPAGLSQAAASVMATLADLDTAVWLGAGLDGQGIAAFVTGQCDAPLAARPAAAAFALVQAADLLPLDRFGAGDEAYPDRSTTVIVEGAALGEGPALTLSGPGIKGSHGLGVGGLPAGFVEAWRQQRAAFPLGVDLVLCTGDRLAALPRSVDIR